MSKKKEISLIIPAGEKSLIEGEKTIDSTRIKLFIERGKNPSANRNRGIIKARTSFVAFINAHTFLDKTWYDEVISFFNRHKDIDIAGGPQLTPSHQGAFASISGLALASLFGGGIVASRYGGSKEKLDADETWVTSANLICRKKVFKKIKFDENIYPGEDPKFISDAIKQGFKIAYSPKILVYNKRRENFPGFVKQIFNYGITRPKKEKIADTLKKPVFLIPSLFLIYVIVLPLLIMITKIFLWPLLAYVVLDFIFSLFKSIISKRISSFFILLIIYPSIHLSYGLGFIIGLIKNIFYRIFY